MSNSPLAPVDKHHFTGKQKDAFVSVLHANDNNTDLLNIDTPQSVFVAAGGLVQGRLRFTKPALKAYCDCLLKGLARPILSLLDSESDSRDYQLAFDIINRATISRGSVLKQRRLVVDSRQNKIVGIVSKKYRMVSNMILLRHVEEYVIGSAKMEFSEAAVFNRYMSLRFVASVPAFQLQAAKQQTEPYFSGICVSNSETGDCAIHVSPTLVRGWTGTTATRLAKSEGGWVAHIGSKHFVKKLFGALDSCKLSTQDLKRLQLNLTKMKQTKLGFTRENARARQDALAGKLMDGGLTAAVTKPLILRMLVEGSYRFDRVKQNEAVSEAAVRRNFYDLFNALTQEARKLAPSDRERAEGMAYRILTGKFLFHIKE